MEKVLLRQQKLALTIYLNLSGSNNFIQLLLKVFPKTMEDSLITHPQIVKMKLLHCQNLMKRSSWL